MASIHYKLHQCSRYHPAEKPRVFVRQRAIKGVRDGRECMVGRDYSELRSNSVRAGVQLSVLSPALSTGGGCGKRLCGQMSNAQM